MNTELIQQVEQLSKQLEDAYNKLEQLSKQVSGSQQTKDQELRDIENMNMIENLKREKADIEKRLKTEVERNRALRFKAGQIFLNSIEQNADKLIKSGALAAKAAQKKRDVPEYYLADDEALMKLIQKID